MSIWHIQLFENCCDTSLLAKTNACASSNFLTVDFNAEELVCLIEICDLVYV